MSTNQRAQITMADAECALFIEQQRTAKIATVGPAGFPHLVAMWYGVIDGQIWFETKLKSQKPIAGNGRAAGLGGAKGPIARASQGQVGKILAGPG